MVDSRSVAMQKCHFAALLLLMVLLAAGVPALAADSIEELLHQDEVDGHNDALRRDLNALTEEQWQYYFKVERKQPDIELGGQLIVRESEERPHVLYIWVAAMVAGFGMVIGAIQASHYMSCRRLCRTIIATADIGRRSRSQCLNRFATSSASETAVAPVVLSAALCDHPEGRIVLKEG
jgi:hypothetical protein